MRRRNTPRFADHGQVLVVVALLLTVLLAMAGLAIDVGRQVAERRHIQTAADAGALAACRALIAGASDSAASADARETALVNLRNSPAGANATIAADGSPVYEDTHAGDPTYLVSGILISGTSVRVAIRSTVPTTVARAIGVASLDTNARARCQLQGGPALPIVARRYVNAPGPGNGFVDTLATDATSGNGQVDALSPTGYDVRTPASESEPGPIMDLYGPQAKAANDSSFRGFVALDIRNFQSTTSRIYYNGVTPGTNVNTLKSKEGAYIADGYLGPMFPPVATPADPNDQVATISGNDSSMVLGNFSQVYAVGDRVLLALYNGTVMQIPDFSISPPTAITLPSTTLTPVNGPNFTVSRNDAFNSTVTLELHGDYNTPNPAYSIIDEPPSTGVPLAGKMNEPTWSPDVFIPAKNGTTVAMTSIRTTSVPAGIYTVWLEGHSGNPYFQTRRYPVPVKVGGAVRDFSLSNSTTSGSIATLGGVVSMPIYVSTTSANTTKWGATGSAVTLGYDTASFTDCSLGAAAIAPGQIQLSSPSVTPSSSGSGALSTLNINTAGLAAGCYRFDVRATGINGDGQPVTHIQPITFTVATTASSGSYVDIIGFAVFEVTAFDSNSISAKAVSGVYANPDDQALRRAQHARLTPW
jgi:Flp pilus assembly protein TadG